MQLKDWSGDWVNLAEAAKIVGKALEAEKTEEDILKAGYLQYLGVDVPLKIYAFVRTLVEMTAAEVSDDLREMVPPISYKDNDTGEEKFHDLWCRALTDAEKQATTDVLTAGDIFQLEWTVLEKMVLLHHWHTMAGGVVFTAISFKELPGWEPDGDWWTASFRARMTPDIEIPWHDLRVDQQELLEFVEKAKKARESGGDGKLDVRDQEVKRDKLILELRDKWVTIESDFSNAHKPAWEGLAAAAVPNRRGYYYLGKAIAWAKEKNKYSE